MPASTKPGVVLTIEELAGLVACWAWPDPRVPIAILWVESGGGNTAAFRPAIANPLGGEDRGLCQWNSKAWPAITDEVAYHPVRCIELMWVHSRQGAEWGPWNYGPKAYGGTPRTLDLMGAHRAFTARRSPWRTLFRGNIDVTSADVAARLPRPAPAPHVSTLPPAPLRFGNSGGSVHRLQRELAAEGAWSRTSFDSYYGNTVKTGVTQLQARFEALGWPGSFLTGTYDEATRRAWDGLRRWAHEHEEM